MKQTPWLTTRNTLTALALMAGLSLGAHAAPAEHSKNHPPRWDYIFTQLDITEEQRAQVHALFKEMASERRAKMQAYREQRNAHRGHHQDRSERRAERQARREQTRQNLQDRLGIILAPDQVEGFLTYLDAHKPGKKYSGRHHKKRGERTRGHR